MVWNWSSEARGGGDAELATWWAQLRSREPYRQAHGPPSSSHHLLQIEIYSAIRNPNSRTCYARKRWTDRDIRLSPVDTSTKSLSGRRIVYPHK